MVHSGEWFLVAQTLFGADVPVIDEDSVLVDWVAAKNGNNSLVIGSTVKNANTINGLSQPGINTINSLLSTDGSNAGVNALAAGVESLSNEGDVRKAGEQLAPETNFATQQAAITLAFLTGQYIDERLLGVGATGPSAAGFGRPIGPRRQQHSASALCARHVGIVRWPHEPRRRRGYRLLGCAFV